MRALPTLTRLIGGLAFLAGLSGLLFGTYLAIALRHYVDYTGQEGLVWPFFGISLLVSLLFCEFGRSYPGRQSRGLLRVELLVLALCVLWYLTEYDYPTL